MSLRLHDTAARAVRDFVPLEPGRASLYLCGATVQAAPHVGHIRSGINFDVLGRWLRASGYEVTFCRNVTDIDDKIIARGETEGRQWWSVATEFEREFAWAYDVLGCTRPTVEPRATGHVPEMVELMDALIATGHAYPVGGDVYFDVRSFPEYGALSGQRPDEMQAAGDSVGDDRKRDPRDFALWKSAREGEPSWATPWGRGRPGWHLECSAMAMDRLGETLDLHCGGIDLIFPHHEDEIAQSEAATGVPFSRVWCHGAFLLTEGAKMAKRVGNVSTVQGLREERFSAAALRHFVFNTHYRKELNLSDEALEASRQAVRRVGDFADRLNSESAMALGGTPELARAADAAVAQAEAALFDDLNGPETLAALFDFIRKANAELDRRGGDRESVERARAAFARIDGILDIVPEREGAAVELARWIDERIAARREARMRRDFAEADQIRDELKGRGVTIEDAGGETRWKMG